MARTAATESNKGIAKLLNNFVKGELSYTYIRKLVDTGHISDTKKIQTEGVRQAGRGRHKIEYELTGKGKGLLNLSKNWK